MEPRSEETMQRDTVIARYCRIRRERRTALYVPFPTQRASAVYHEPSLSVGTHKLEEELVKVFLVYSDVRQIRLDLFCLPTFACENEVREPRGRVGWKFRTRVKAPESARGEGILTVSPSNLRDVLEMNVSPTAAFHLVMNSSSDIGSLYKYQPETKL